MKHLKSLGFAVAAFALAFTSCETPAYQTKVAYVENALLSNRPVVTELDVNPQKITETYTLPSGKNLSLDKAKQEVFNQALVKYDADVLVEPHYYPIYEKGKLAKVVVKAYRANYKNFRDYNSATDDYLQNLPQAVLSKALSSQSNGRTLDMKYSNVLQIPIVGQYAYSKERVSVTIPIKLSNHFYGTGVMQDLKSQSQEKWEQVALQKLEFDNNADLIIDPKYSVNADATRLTVTAYIAHLTSFRSVTREEILSALDKPAPEKSAKEKKQDSDK